MHREESTPKNQIITIALDSAEITLIEKWVQEEKLPNLKALFQNSLEP